MSLEEIAKHHAKIIFNATEIIERSTRIREQTGEIVAQITEGQVPKITRTNVDPALYQALDDLGYFGKPVAKKPALKKAPVLNDWLRKSQVLPTTASTTSALTAAAAVAPPPTLDPARELEEISRTLAENKARLHALVSLLDDEDMDETLRGRYQAEHDVLTEQQTALFQRQNEVIFNTPSQQRTTKKREAPAQTPVYRAAKKPANPAVRKLTFSSTPLPPASRQGDAIVSSNGYFTTGSAKKPENNDDDDEDADRDDKVPSTESDNEVESSNNHVDHDDDLDASLRAGEN